MIGALEHFGVAKLGADTHATIVLADSIKEVRPPARPLIAVRLQATHTGTSPVGPVLQTWGELVGTLVELGLHVSPSRRTRALCDRAVPTAASQRCMP